MQYTDVIYLSKDLLYNATTNSSLHCTAQHCTNLYCFAQSIKVHHCFEPFGSECCSTQLTALYERMFVQFSTMHRTGGFFFAYNRSNGLLMPVFLFWVEYPSSNKNCNIWCGRRMELWFSQPYNPFDHRH